MSPEAKWVYYITSYTKVEPTEGVPIEGHVSMPFLKRNLPEDIEEPEPKERSVPYLYQSDLEFHICVNSYKIDYDKKGIDWFVHSKKQRISGFKGPVNLDRVSENRRSKFREKFVLNNKWTKELDKDEVDRVTKKFSSWVDQGPDPNSVTREPNSQEEDQVMADV